MKRIASIFLILALFAVAPISCAKWTMDHTVIPSLVSDSDTLKDNVDAGIEALPIEDRAINMMTASQFFVAIKTKDKGAIKSQAGPRWATVKSLAESGIAARIAKHEIGEWGGKIQQSNVDAFGDNLARVLAE